MMVHDWGVVAYAQAREQMQRIHSQALNDGNNHLILCSHPNVFTVGDDEKGSFDVDVIRSDRGGSITCHSLGQNIFYFCFPVLQPAKFYKNVLLSFESFFSHYLPDVRYDKQNPGFYIKNRKIASLGFRYSQGVSLHGVALNRDVDLAFHSKVNPCNLQGIIPTSLKAEGVELTQKQLNDAIVQTIAMSFNDDAL